MQMKQLEELPWMLKPRTKVVGHTQPCSHIVMSENMAVSRTSNGVIISYLC